jgi:uncharacterized membrane protein (UPF0136 family)
MQASQRILMLQGYRCSYYGCAYSWRWNLWIHQDWLHPLSYCWCLCWNLGEDTLTSMVMTISLQLQYLVGGYRMQNKLSYGVELALLASVILAGASIPRAIRGGKPLPTGLSALALFGLYTYGSAYLKK